MVFAAIEDILERDFAVHNFDWYEQQEEEERNEEDEDFPAIPFSALTEKILNVNIKTGTGANTRYEKFQMTEELAIIDRDKILQLELQSAIQYRTTVAEELVMGNHKIWCSQGVNAVCDVVQRMENLNLENLRSKPHVTILEEVAELIQQSKEPDPRESESKASEKQNDVPRKRLKSNDGDYNPSDEDMDEEEKEYDPSDEEYSTEEAPRESLDVPVRKKGYNRDGKKRQKTVHYDDLDLKNKENWSECRKQAYNDGKTKGNSYYYRFVEGPKKKGPWEWDEEVAFFTALKSHGANWEWGTFIKGTVKGRCGYDASTHWRALHKCGYAWDINYIYDTHSSTNWLSKNDTNQIRKRDFSPEAKKDFDKIRRYGFIVFADPTKTFATTFPAFHSKAPKWFVDKFKNHPLVVKHMKKAEKYSIPLHREKKPFLTDPDTHIDLYSPIITKNPQYKLRSKLKAKFKRNPTEEEVDYEMASDKGEDVKKPKPVTEKPKKKKASKKAKKATGKSKTRKRKQGTASKKTTKRTKRRKKSCSDDETLEFNYTASPTVDILPDFMDAVTLEPVVRPCISPYGHVLSQNTWAQVLKKNRCPFTGQRLTRRQLVKLNAYNIEEYRSKIIEAVPTTM